MGSKVGESDYQHFLFRSEEMQLRAVIVLLIAVVGTAPLLGVLANVSHSVAAPVTSPHNQIRPSEIPTVFHNSCH